MTFPVNNTRSLWASSAHYIQAYMAGTLLTEPSSRLLTLLLMSTVNHRLVVRSLWSSQCARRPGIFGHPVYYFMMKWWVWKVSEWSQGILHAFGKSSMCRKITVSVLHCCGWQWRWIEDNCSILWILIWQTVRNRGPGWTMGTFTVITRWLILGFMPKSVLWMSISHVSRNFELPTLQHPCFSMNSPISKCIMLCPTTREERGLRTLL